MSRLPGGRILAAVLALSALAAAGGALSAAAHPLAPSLLELRETAPGRAQVLWRTPLVRPAGAALEPVLPEDCPARSAPRRTREAGGLATRWEIVCARGDLVGRSVGVRGLGAGASAVLVRVELADGRSVRRVLGGDPARLVIPAASSPWRVARDYTRLGAAHIAGGPDHLLFILGLVLLMPGRRRLLVAISAFTAGHSLTLALAVLGWIRVSPAVAEAAIAATILVVAVELTRPPGGRRGHGMLLTGGFGLVHGLGFAGTLARVGLPQDEIPLALAVFNVGIELGQLAFVAGLLALGALAARGPRLPEVGRRLVPAYAIGALAAFWLWERVAALS